MTELRKIAKRIEASLDWIQFVQFYKQELDGILFFAQDQDLGEPCWIKLFNGKDLYISYNRYHDNWTYLLTLRSAI